VPAPIRCRTGASALRGAPVAEHDSTRGCPSRSLRRSLEVPKSTRVTPSTDSTRPGYGAISRRGPRSNRRTRVASISSQCRGTMRCPVGETVSVDVAMRRRVLRPPTHVHISRPCQKCTAHAPPRDRIPRPCQHARLLRNSPATWRRLGATRASRSRRRGSTVQHGRRREAARGGARSRSRTGCRRVRSVALARRGRVSGLAARQCVGCASSVGGPAGCRVGRPGPAMIPTRRHAAQPWAATSACGPPAENRRRRSDQYQANRRGGRRPAQSVSRRPLERERPRPAVRGDHRRSVGPRPRVLDRQPRAGRPWKRNTGTPEGVRTRQNRGPPSGAR